MTKTKKTPNVGVEKTTRQTHFLLCALFSLVAVCVTYANHFHNGFHFDDAHAVVNNIYIRDLHNIPLFFRDARTGSSLPANQVWRPILMTSLAIDYYLGHGLDPLWFHISTFLWFIVQLLLMFVMFRHVFDTVAPDQTNRYSALFAVTWYGLHPAMAETVNYIIQSADLLSTVGVVAGMVMYIRLPRLRKYCLYLIPVAIGAMAKAPAVVFCGILFVYTFLFEEDAQWSRLFTASWKSVPAIIVCGVFAVLNVKMVSNSFTPTGMASSAYWATQPFVILRYVRSFFLPLWLSADTDLGPLPGFASPEALLGIAFCAALILVALWTIKRKEFRPISFGIFWFFFALAPTCVFVLAEVENDHRMYFPFVGLMLSVVWAATLLIRWAINQRPDVRTRIVRVVQFAAILILVLSAVGTRKRNQVWASEETLWQDVTVKSPLNGRGWMNYGLTKMARGDFAGALLDYERAQVYSPAYYYLEINEGVDLGAMNRNAEAEPHFQRAIALQPQDAQPYFFYGRWLKMQGRIPESIWNEKMAIARNPGYFDARYLLMQTYLEQHQWAAMKELARDTLKIAPSDPAAMHYLSQTDNGKAQIGTAEKLAESRPTASHYLDLSLLYHENGMYPDCVKAAQKAIQLQPNFPEAYNNIAAAYEAMGEWDAAIHAAQQALQLRPDFQLAKNNLAWSLSQKKLKSH